MYDHNGIWISVVTLTANNVVYLIQVIFILSELNYLVQFGTLFIPHALEFGLHGLETGTLLLQMTETCCIEQTGRESNIQGGLL